MSLTAIDFTKVGKTPVGKVKVAKLKEKWRKADGTSAILWVEVEGLDRAFQMWEPKNGKLEVGNEFDASVEIKAEQYNGKEQLAVWLVPAAAAKGGNGYGGGGGGGVLRSAPKDEGSIVAQTILKEACESARSDALKANKPFDVQGAATLAAGLAEIYLATYAKLKGVHGS